MIPNITCGSSLTNLVGYHESKVKSGKAIRLDGVNIVSENQNSDHMRIYGSIASVEEKYNGRSELLTFHLSLSFAPEDDLNDEKMSEVAKSFMDKMGYGNQPYQVYRHFDRTHNHIHVVSTRVNEEGKLISDAQIKYKGQRFARKIEEEFNLIKVSSERQKPSMKPFTAGQEIVKNEALIAINNALYERKATSFKELQEILKENKIEGRIIDQPRGNRVSGPGITFFLTKEPQGQWTKGIAGSKLDPNFSFKGLQKILAENRIALAPEAILSLNERAKIALDDYASKNDKNKELLAETLALQNLRPIYLQLGKGVFALEIAETNGDKKIKSGLLGQEYNWSRLKEGIETKENTQRNLLGVYKQLEKSAFFSENDIQQKLTPLGVKAEFARNTGGVYGISFKDIATGEIYKASDVHSSLSWNKLKDGFLDDKTPVLAIKKITQEYAERLKVSGSNYAGNQTVFLQILARNGVNLIEKDGSYKLALNNPSTEIPLKELTGNKSFAEYFGLKEKTLTKEVVFAIRNQKEVVMMLTEKEQHTYRALLEGHPKTLTILAARNTLPSLHPLEGLAFEKSIKLFDQAKILHQALRKTEKFLAWVEQKNIKPLTVTEQIRALNRRGIGIEIGDRAQVKIKPNEPVIQGQPAGYKKEIIGVTLTLKENSTISLKENEFSRLIADQLSNALIQLSPEELTTLREDLASRQLPGFAQDITKEQELYFDACDRGNGKNIYLGNLNGNALELDITEMHYFREQSPQAFNEGMGVLETNIDSSSTSLDFLEQLSHKGGENPTNQGEQELKKVGKNTPVKGGKKRRGI